MLGARIGAAPAAVQAVVLLDKFLELLSVELLDLVQFCDMAGENLDLAVEVSVDLLRQRGLALAQHHRQVFKLLLEPQLRLLEAVLQNKLALRIDFDGVLDALELEGDVHHRLLIDLLHQLLRDGHDLMLRVLLRIVEAVSAKHSAIVGAVERQLQAVHGAHLDVVDINQVKVGRAHFGDILLDLALAVPRLLLGCHLHAAAGVLAGRLLVELILLNRLLQKRLLLVLVDLLPKVLLGPGAEFFIASLLPPGLHLIQLHEFLWGIGDTLPLRAGRTRNRLPRERLLVGPRLLLLLVGGRVFLDVLQALLFLEQGMLLRDE